MSAMKSATVLPAWLQQDSLRGGLLHRRPRVGHRMVPAVRPVFQQIRVVTALRVAGFAGDIGHHGTVPVAQVEDLAVRCAVGLPKSGAAGGSAGRIDRVGVAGSGDGTSVPLRLIQWMTEFDLMETAPCPGGRVRPEF